MAEAQNLIFESESVVTTLGVAVENGQLRIEHTLRLYDLVAKQMQNAAEICDLVETRSRKEATNEG